MRLLLFFGCILWSVGVFAQSNAFLFSYTGPNTFPVGSDCSATLQQAIQPLPTVSSAIGANIITSQLDVAMTGYTMTDPISKNETVTVFWFVADDQGNSHSFPFNILFIDNSPPYFDTMGVSSLILVSSVVQVPPIPNLTAIDNCVGIASDTFSETPYPDTCAGGTIVRTWTATDMEGNTGTFVQTIQVFADTLPPFINVAPQNGGAPCEILSTAYPAWLSTQTANFQATDPSGIKSLTNNAPPTFPPGCAQTLTVRFRAEDNCNRVSFRDVQFVTADTKPPILLSGPRDTVGYCSPLGNHLDKLGEWIAKEGFLNAIDSCTAPDYMQYDLRVNGVLRDSAGVVNDFLSSFDGSCQSMMIGGTLYDQVVGHVTVEFTVKDGCGTSIPGGQATFAAIDTFPPLISGPAVYTEECGGGNDQAALANWINTQAGAVLSDDCSTKTWTAFSWTTADGQTGSGTFNAGPYPAPPAHRCDWYVDVAFAAADGCGNVRSDTFRFQLIDTTAPVFSGLLPVDTLYCPAVIPGMPPADWTDNCDTLVAIARNTTVSDSLCGGRYTLTVTWTATDDCGNTASLVHDFAVVDTTPPLITQVPADVTLSCDAVVLPAPPVLGGALQATDACGSISGFTFSDVSAQNPDPGDCGHYTYTISRIFTVNDDCGNSATASQTIFVRDTSPPVFSGFIDTTTVCEVQPVMPPPTAADACSGPTAAPTLLSQVVVNGPCEDTYILRLTWEAQDVCLNVGTFVQDIHVVDTVRPTLTGIPPDVTVACDAIPVLPTNIQSADNCDETVAVSFLETEIRNPDTASCDRWSNYLIRREWTATDNCGNTSRYTQSISVTDNVGPVLVVRDTLLVPASPGLCSFDYYITPPLALYDVCSSAPLQFALQDTIPITNSSGLPPDSAPIDTIRFAWAAPVIPPGQPVTANATLTIYLDNADSETDNERLQIWGEDGAFLGYTVKTPAQCSSSVTTLTIQADLLNAWLPDGDLVITLTPLGVGADYINAICTGRQVRASVNITAASPFLDINLMYSLNGGPLLTYPPAAPTPLPVGYHSVLYQATDCAGNSSTGVTVIRVDDLQAPVVFAPPPFLGFVSADSCAATVTLPFPGLSENCAFSDDLSRSSPAVTLTFENDANAGLVPKEQSLTVPGLVPNAVLGGTLRILHRGDNESLGEFFAVFDENNNFLGSTTPGDVAGQCSEFHETPIAVSAGQINTWAANGSALFRLRANRDAANFSDFIGPCGPLNGANQDGISAVQAILEYNFAAVTYEVADALGSIVASGLLNGNQTQLSLPPGNYTVRYRVLDESGNAGMASYPLIVSDTVAPVAKCKNVIIFTNPTGAATYTLTPGEVNNGSIDNCTNAGLGFALSQTTFTCNQAGSIIPVTLTVTDTSGNTSSCIASVRIETVGISPTYTTGICMGDTAQLFANPPSGASFTYQWSGPSFGSALQNPFILNTTPAKEGVYSVTITGPTGCTSTGQVVVDFVELPEKPGLIALDDSICFGQNINLVTNVVGGANVSYQWYQGVPPNGVLLASTGTPSYQINLPAVGNASFYVVVTANGCASIPSNHRNIVVSAGPESSVQQPNLELCAGQPLTLGTTVQGPGITYSWSGPGGFTSSAQYPTVTPNADAIHSGPYTLLVFQNGCSSGPAVSNVTVKPRPALPQIAGPGAVCLSDTAKLITDVNGSGNDWQWQWISPFFDTTTITGVNEFVLTPVSLQDSGIWRVIVLLQGCASEPSGGHLLRVLAEPEVQASANTPLCAGQLLSLNATADVDNLVFSWSGPSGYSSSSQNPTTAGVSGRYIVIGRTQGASCADTAFVDVEVIPLPVINDITNTAPACADGTTDAVLQPTVFPPAGPYEYAWTGPNGMFFSADPMPVIPNITAANSGPYTLVITDTFGCASAPATELITVSNQPVTPVIALVSAVCEGEPVILQISNAAQYMGANITYTWQRPLIGPIITTEPELPLGNVTLAQAGLYTVTVKIGNCTSLPSTSVNVVVNPIPEAPAVFGPSVVCTGEALELFTPPVNGQYFWEGPGGWSSSVQSPVITSATPANAGAYRVRILVNGCFSPWSSDVVVDVRPKPKTPVILPGQAVCLDQPGSILQLLISGSSTTPGAQYVWLSQSSGDTLSGPGFATALILSDLSPFTPGANGVYAFAYLDGCLSTPSAAVLVQMDTIPDLSAFAGNDRIICGGANVTLAATTPSVGSGLWTQVGGPVSTIVDPNLATSLVTGLVAPNTYLYRWTLTNGACVNYSADEVALQVVPFEVAEAEAFKDTCYVESVVISAQPGQNAVGYWSQPQVQAQLGVVIADPDEAVTVVDNLGTGVYYFFWTLETDGCPPSTDTVVVRVIGTVAFAGNDANICSADSCTALNASALPANETGLWTSPNPNLRFSSATSPNTTVCGLVPGPNVCIWTTNGGLCGNLARDTVVINFEVTPTAVNDTVTVPFGVKVTYDVLFNDILPKQYNVEVIQMPDNGLFENLGNGIFTYQPDVRFTGQDVMVYKVCNINCVDACDFANVVLKVQEPTGCVIPTVITPNNDGVNDVFFVPCLNADVELDNAVTIFNRWGDEVFHESPYGNNWNGTFNGEPLPVGTYFYVVKFNGDAGTQSGFIIIQR